MSTPGPWRVDAKGDVRHVWVEFGMEFTSSVIARIPGKRWMNRSNVALITAAPDMLAPLQSLVTCQDTKQNDIRAALNNARAVIAKATTPVVQHLPADDTEGGAA